MPKKQRATIGTILKMAQVTKCTGPKSWYEKLNEEDRKWCDGIRKEFNSGDYPNVTASSLCRIVRDEIGIKIAESAFRYWLKSI